MNNPFLLKKTPFVTFAFLVSQLHRLFSFEVYIDENNILSHDTPGQQLDNIVDFIQSVSMNISAVSSVPTETVPLCPAIKYFEPVLLDTISCRDFMAEQARQYEDTSVKRVREDHFHTNVKTCTCTGHQITRSCFMHFFGPLEKDEQEATFIVTDDECYIHCDTLWKSQDTSLDVGGPPDWSCNWMQRTTVTNNWINVKMVWARGDLLNSRITHQFLVGGECPMSAPSCEFVNGAKLVIQDKPSYTIKDITDATSYKEDYETRKLQGISNPDEWMWVRSKGAHKPHLLHNKCCVLLTDPSNQCIVRSSAGQYFVSPVKDPKLCDKTERLSILPLIPEVSLDPSVDDMLMRQQICHVTKQSVMNAAASRTKILQELMKVFDEPSDDGTTVWKYFTSGGKLLKSACGIVTFDNLEWECPNIWFLKRGDVKVGCYDQMADLAHPSGCICHNNQSRDSFMGRYIPFFNTDKQRWDAKRLSGNIPEIIAELAVSSEGYLEYINSINTPTGVVVYSDPVPKAIIDKIEETSTRAGANIGNWFSNMFSNIRSFFTGLGVIILVLVVLGIGLVVAKKVIEFKTGGGYKKM